MRGSGSGSPGWSGACRDVFPEARFGYPCLAGGGDVIGRQMNATTFFDQSSSFAGEADWIAVACELDVENVILEKCLTEFSEKPIWITERRQFA